MELRFYYDYSGKNIVSYELVNFFSNLECSILTGKNVYNGMCFTTVRLPEWHDIPELVKQSKKYITKKKKIIGILQYCFRKTGNQAYKEAEEKLCQYKRPWNFYLKKYVMKYIRKL